MPLRNHHRPGDWLAVCDESGIVGYASQMVKRWDGLFVRPQAFETRHPQEFVRARNDPVPLRDVRPMADLALGCASTPVYIGTTTIRTLTNNATGARYQPGIGAASTGCDFLVF